MTLLDSLTGSSGIGSSVCCALPWQLPQPAVKTLLKNIKKNNNHNKYL
jgi:hypothetical protein